MYVTVVSLDNPHPADYGGAIDLFYKLEALAEAQAQVDLCFYHKPDRAAVSPELRRLVSRITPIARQAKVKHLLNRQLPYFVASRPAAPLRQALAQQPAEWAQSPILWDGLHTTAALPALRLAQPERRHILRAHNSEAHYYAELADSEASPLKRLYFQREVSRLKRYEPQMAALCHGVQCISSVEVQTFAAAQPNTAFLPAFLPANNPPAERNPATAHFTLLYHANFSIAPNAHAARHLAQHILPKIEDPAVRLCLAGRAADTLGLPPDPRLVLLPNPSDVALHQALADADLCVLPATQASGVQLKYLMTLRAQRPAITTAAGAGGSGLEHVAVVYPDDRELIKLISAARTGALNERFARQQAAFDTLYHRPSQAQQLLAALAT